MEAMNGGRDLRRTVTLSQQLTMESEYDSPVNARGRSGPWDGNSLRSASGRTLFDIINQDDNWKPVKDRLRLQRVGAAFSGGPSPEDEPPVVRCPMIDTASSSATNNVVGSRMASGHPSLRRNSTLARSMTRSVSVQPRSVGSTPKVGEIVITEITDVSDVPDENEHEEDDEDEDEKVEEQAKEDTSGQGAVSLMALLEQTDNQWGDDGPSAPEEGLDFPDDGEDEFDEDEDGDREGIYHVCCVCMVRHKGAAFIPCGHTFCRLCSRELWVSRGNCPLCNGFIQEILDIF